MSRFPTFRLWVSQRRADIEDELSVLKALETPRSALLSKSTAQITDQAVLAANAFTQGEAVRSELAALVETIVTNSIPESSGTASPVVQEDVQHQFINEALALLGFSLKARASEVVNGLLATACTTLKAAAQSAVTAASAILSYLSELQGQKVGQGQALSPSDPRISSVIQDLTSAKEGADRLLANLVGPVAINTALSQQIQSYLNSALANLTQDTVDLHQLDATTAAMVAQGQNAEMAQASVQASMGGLTTFKAEYEAKFTGLSSDRSSAVGLSSSIGGLLDTVNSAKENKPDLAQYQQGWAMEISALLAVARESRASGAQSVFSVDVALNTQYLGLVSVLNQVPDTDVSKLTQYLGSLRGFLLGTSSSPGFQEQYDAIYSTALNLTVLLRDRSQTILDALNMYTFATSDLAEQFRKLVKDSKLTTVETALQQGLVGTLFSAEVATANQSTTINGEVKTFAASGLAKGTILVNQLSVSVGVVQEFEGDDIYADQGFENARLNAIADLESDLQRLDQIQSLLDKADAL